MTHEDAETWTAASTIVIAAFTIVLAAVGGVQGCLIRRQIRLARDEFNATHRPRIIVRDVRQLHCNPGDPIEIKFRVINVGASNGRIIASRFETSFFGSGETYKGSETPEVEGTNTIGDKVIVPNGVLVLTHVGGKWHEDHFHAFPEPEKGFFFGGKIIYRDDIGNVRRVGIFRRLDVDSRRFRPIQDPDYEYED